MTRDQQLAAIFKACLQANLDNRDRLEIGVRAVRLTDVLLAVKEKEKQQEDAIGIEGVKYPLFYKVMQVITHHDMSGGEFWNLRQDDLAEQGDETIKFLADLLA
jgi:hypothetical protein